MLSVRTKVRLTLIFLQPGPVACMLALVESVYAPRVKQPLPTQLLAKRVEGTALPQPSAPQQPFRLKRPSWESLRISPEPKLPTPPRSPSTATLGMLPTFSRYSPPLGTMTNRHSHVSVVQSHTGNVMSARTSTPQPNPVL